MKTESYKNELRPLILVAEDDQSNFLFLKVVLTKAGFQIIHAANGAEAVELCKSIENISLILMDIKMPVMNGIEATAHIKKFRAELPIIAVTAFAQTDDEYHILKAGCDEYMTKPVNPVELLASMNKYLKN